MLSGTSTTTWGTARRLAMERKETWLASQARVVFTTSAGAGMTRVSLMPSMSLW